IVVDRTDKADNHQLRMPRSDLLTDLAALDQLGQQARPFLAEQIGAGQAAVAADYDEAVDLVRQQVAGRQEAARAGAKSGAACRADEGAAALHDAADGVPADLADAVAAVEHPLIALV